MSPVPIDLLDIGGWHVGQVEDNEFGDGRATTECFGLRHVEPGRHDVGQLVRRQCGLVTINTLRLFLTIPRPKPPEDEVGTHWKWLGRKSKDSPALTHPIADVNMVVPLRRGSTRLRRLAWR